MRLDPLRDIGDARIEIGDALIPAPSDSTITHAAAFPAVPTQRVGGLGRYVGVAALVLTALVVGYLASGLRPTPTTEVWNTQQITRLQAIESQPSLSPDGQFIVYTSDQRGNHDIYWQLVDGCFRNQLLLLHTYLVLTKPLSHDIQCQRCVSVKIGCKYLDNWSLSSLRQHWMTEAPNILTGAREAERVMEEAASR